MFMESSNIIFRCSSVLCLYPSMCWHGRLAAIRLWYFSFPTHTELLMWRISSVGVTAVPFYTLLTLILVALLDSRKLQIDNGNLPISIAHSVQKRKTCYNTQIWFDNNRYAKIEKSLPKAMYYPPKFPLIAFRLFSTISSSLTTRPPVSFCTSAAMASTRALSEPISDTYTPST